MQSASRKELHRLIVERDRHRCLCCGSIDSLQIDHIQPRRHGGQDTFDNWQTLCQLCNLGKRTRFIDFRETKSRRTVEDKHFPLLRPPLKRIPYYLKDAWVQYVQRTINLYYYCSAVESVNIFDQQKAYKRVWQVTLREENDPYLIQHQLVTLQKRVCWAFECHGSLPPEQMAVTLSGKVTVVSEKPFEKFIIPDFSR